MQHSIQQLMDRVSAIHGLAVQCHRMRYENAEGTYDEAQLNHLVEQIQAMCGSIYNDRNRDFDPASENIFKLARKIIHNN